jgi:hypothetical protein
MARQAHFAAPHVSHLEVPELVSLSVHHCVWDVVTPEGLHELVPPDV